MSELTVSVWVHEGDLIIEDEGYYRWEPQIIKIPAAQVPTFFKTIIEEIYEDNRLTCAEINRPKKEKNE